MLSVTIVGKPEVMGLGYADRYREVGFKKVTPTDIPTAVRSLAYG
jgi:hypothetical protein